MGRETDTDTYGYIRTHMETGMDMGRETDTSTYGNICTHI